MWYPQNRALSKGDKLDSLVLLNAKLKDMKEAIHRETGLSHSQRKLRTGGITDRFFFQHLNGIDGWTTHIEKNEDDDLLFLLLQSEHMRQLTENYPKVLFFDGTYKANLEGYVLHAVLCQDPTGHGRPVCYAFVQRETSDIVQSALEKFLELDPIVKDKCKVAVTDKDFNEMNVLSKLLPGCKILLCSWHVLKYLQTNVRRQSRSNTLDKDNVNKIIKPLVFVHEVADYDHGES